MKTELMELDLELNINNDPVNKYNPWTLFVSSFMQEPFSFYWTRPANCIKMQREVPSTQLTKQAK